MKLWGTARLAPGRELGGAAYSSIYKRPLMSGTSPPLHSFRLFQVNLIRYDTRSSQSTLDVINRLAVALSVSSDALLFDSEERGPDQELRNQFEAIRHFDPGDRKVAKAVLDGLILKSQAKKLLS